MREDIKFRGKRCDNGEWVYGLVTPWCFIKSFELDNDIDSCLEVERREYRVYPETVTQFTGLKDHTGKEIYEGDVVQLSGTYVNEYYGFERATVRWLDQYACFGFVIRKSMHDVDDPGELVYECGLDSDFIRDYTVGRQISIAHVLNHSFNQPVPEFLVIGNIFDNFKETL